MVIDKDKSISAGAGLRRRAEEQLNANVPDAGGIPRADHEAQRLLYELQVHQIELEMQNVELRQSRDDAEQSLEKYSDLYEFAPVGYFTLDLKGVITSVNLRGASLVGVARPRLLGQRFGHLVTDEHRQIYTDFLDALFLNRDKTACEVALTNRENRPRFVQLEAMATISGQECGLVLVDITERKQSEDDLRRYARRLTEIEEELRNKIATELHDEICRDLTVLGMNMSIISDGMKDVVPKRLTARAKASGKIIKSISHTVRNIMVGLRPPMLEDYGLLATLRWHADLFSKRNGIAVAFEADELFPRLTADQETVLFRISQEAHMNVIKHAAARTVTIKLRKSGGMIRFSVVDDGEGFLPKVPSHIQNSSGWGVKIMRERAELIGGTFQMESVLGKGTTVSIVMPLEDV
ncbi:MAG: PAS domain S-box protein [Proteobacteria bacterium]|nr:PAS domain S-box protein [Pseudomonadota bacterium]